MCLYVHLAAGYIKLSANPSGMNVNITLCSQHHQKSFWLLWVLTSASGVSVSRARCTHARQYTGSRWSPLGLSHLLPQTIRATRFSSWLTPLYDKRKSFVTANGTRDVMKWRATRFCLLQCALMIDRQLLRQSASADKNAIQSWCHIIIGIDL